MPKNLQITVKAKLSTGETVTVPINRNLEAGVLTAEAMARTCEQQAQVILDELHGLDLMGSPQGDLFRGMQKKAEAVDRNDTGDGESNGGGDPGDEPKTKAASKSPAKKKTVKRAATKKKSKRSGSSKSASA